jgi:prepilin-type N-terminal cleavage/methylation domain-containing protein
MGELRGVYMNRRGFTLIELLVAIIIVGAMSAFFFPRIADTLQKQNVRSARNAITTLHAKARAIAIQRGRRVWFVHAILSIRRRT